MWLWLKYSAASTGIQKGRDVKKGVLGPTYRGRFKTDPRMQNTKVAIEI